MLRECGPLAEGLPTLGTGEGPLAGVDAPVLGEVGALPEALAAVGTGEGPFDAVHAPVLQQYRAAPEVPSALHATKGLVPVVLKQHGASWEAFTTLTALEGARGLGGSWEGQGGWPWTRRRVTVNALVLQ